MPAKHEIVGTWRLISFGLHLTSNTTAPPILFPLGESPLGRIVFTPNGYMSCLLTRPDVAESMKSSSWMQASEEEIAAVARSMTTYCGPFHLYQEHGKNLLKTSVEIALDPTWIGKPQIREWEVKHKGTVRQLVLKPVQEFALPDGTRVVGILIWEQLSEEPVLGNL